MTTKTNVSKFTPAPWSVKQSGEHGKGVRVVHKIAGNVFGAIADISTIRSSDDNFSDATEQANAQLIASAPDLLNMLQRVMDEVCMTEDGMKHVCNLTLEHARNALAKAKGGV